MRIIVTGLVGLYPVGGVAWDYLQYAIGLRRMGHDVYYSEDTWQWPFHPGQNSFVDDASYSAHFIQEFFARHDPSLLDRWHYRHLDRESHGMALEDFNGVAASADLFVNVSGSNRIPETLNDDAIKVFIDTDPGYNQVVYLERPDWSENVDRWADLVDGHDVHFTYAENIDDPSCTVPDIGIDWRTTRMPVVPELWPVAPANIDAPWTTVMTWNAFRGPLTHDGKRFGAKDVEFRHIESLPHEVDQPFLVALGGAAPPRGVLEGRGWAVKNAPAATATPTDYQHFIQGSRGEVSVAKHIYVAMQTGWFSTRSACYLASGRPVVVQDTGFPEALRDQPGVTPFVDSVGAAAAVRAAQADYAAHRAGARAIAEDYFGSDRVLGDLLERASTSRQVP